MRRSSWAATGLVALCLAVVPTAGASSGARGGLTHGSITGKVTALSGSLLTIQTPGRQVGVVNALVAAATRVTHQDYPYVYGGGHAQAGTASVGIPGPGYNGKRRGYDCSGSVAAVLAAAGLWPAGSGVPADNGIISQLRSEHLISRGAGQGPLEVTLYDDPGVHIFMNIDGRFFGTSDGAGGGDSRGGAGWLNDGAPDATSSTYKRFHFRLSALHASVNSGHEVTFDLGSLASFASQLQVGERMKVSYAERNSGLFMATAVAPPHGGTATGTVTEIASDGSTFTIQESTGQTQTFSTAQDPALVRLIASGDAVQVAYTRHGSTLSARLVTVSGASSNSGGPQGGGYGGQPGGWGDGNGGQPGGWGDGGGSGDGSGGGWGH